LGKSLLPGLGNYIIGVEMRRKDKEITDKDLIGKIIAQAQVCRLGLCKDSRPYIVPVSFGYDGKFMYFHTAREGMKIDFMSSNNQVCIELEHDVKVIPNNNSACKWTFSFYSVIGFGTVEEITDSHVKVYAFNRIMKQYSNREWDFNEQLLEKTRLWRISIEQISCKGSKDKIAI
jgi:nitroimidazol reductase NimA-like FMN-containing flavoprotein (pyridoxamine 5'-phosphate oxidase superfamily)